MNASLESLSWKDDIAERLAAFAVASPPTSNADLLHAAKRVLTDTIAVGLGAFHHPAARAARRYLEHFALDSRGASIWGTRLRAPADKATLVNGVLLRCYDYNDVMLAKRGAGHPSDMIAALLAYGEWKNVSGMDLLQALIVGYEVAEALHDVCPAEASGWDHANVSALGATCALGRMMNLTHDQMTEALGIAALQHVQSNEIESSALNRRGDLTMWKRFHGADAMRHALDSCLLAAAGAEGPVRPFRGALGFLRIFGATEDPGPYLADRLAPGRFTSALVRTNLKRWPVGSRAQSAIASALDARRQAGGAEIVKVAVRTERDAYHHLVAIRQDPWRPISRETADHSLPYIVGAAVLDGRIDIASFDLDKVENADRARFIAERVEIEAVDALSPGSAPGRHLTQVDVVTRDGARFEGLVEPGPGHHDNPFTPADLSDKLHENSDALIGPARADALLAAIADLETRSVRDVTENMTAG